MQTVNIPWAMWYGAPDGGDKFPLTFPDSWDITVAEMKGGPDIVMGGFGAPWPSRSERRRCAS